MEQVVPSVLQRLRAVDILRMAGLTAAALGQEYCRTGMVHSTRRQGTRLFGIVDAHHTSPNRAASTANEAESLKQTETGQRLYTVEIEILSPASWKSICSCSPNTSVLCPHAAAVLYQWLARPTAFAVPNEERTNDLPAGNTMEIGQLAHLVGTNSATRPHEEQNAAEGSTPTLSPSLAMHAPAFTRSPDTNGSRVRQHGPAARANTADILNQIGLSELRTIAREFEVATNGLSKQQIVEILLDTLRQSETVRRVAAALEKPQRQLLAALVLAGGAMTDEDLRGLFERFALGQPGQFQNMVTTLQGKGLLFRTNLNNSTQPRIGLGGTLLEVGWYVPAEVRSALRVTVPITQFALENTAVIEPAKPYGLLADLLLVARALNGQRIEKEDEGDQQNGKSAHYRAAGPLSSPRLTGSPVTDGFMTLLPTSTLSASLLTLLQAAVPRSPAFLRFAVELLRLSDILYKENETASVRVLPNAAELLLGPARTEVVRDLFELWLTHASTEELFALQEDGLHLRCRTTSLNYPLLRPGELEAENSEARQAIVALLAQVSLDSWITFPAFARFVYRLNPLFLQKRQRLFSTPHWWIEQEEGQPLHPLQLQDWLRAEFSYLTHLLCGPLHWWGICDLALGSDGHLLAFRLTPFAGWLLSGIAANTSGEELKEYELPGNSVEVVDADKVLITSTPAAWPLLQVIETFAQVAGVRDGRLCYRMAPQALSEAMSRGEHPAPLLNLLRSLISPDARPNDPLAHLLAQLEHWVASYGQVRLYTDVALLEVADTAVVRELVATTSLEKQIVRTLQPTVFILKKAGAGQIIDELKRRGQTPLLYDEDTYGAE